MPALVAGIHVLNLESNQKTWMAGTSPAMTSQTLRALVLSQEKAPFEEWHRRDQIAIAVAS
jgi:hypothetical protein